jgi:TatD DNase family protein
MELSGWTDTHAHLADAHLAERLPELCAEAISCDVRRILCVAVDADSLQTIDRIFEEFPKIDQPKPSIWCSVGIHPNYAHQEKPGDWDQIVLRAEGPGVCALGETGLDKYWDDCPLEVQQSNFRRHWELSRRTELPVIIHSRDCDGEMLEALRSQYRDGELHGVMHSFCSTYDVAMECIEMGLMISFSGMLTYKKNDTLRQIAARLPIERLLVETDAPYLSPEPKRAARPNQPAYVAYTGRVLADLHHRSEGEMARITTENALRLFQRMR